MIVNRGRIHTFQECPRKYYYQYVLNLQKPMSGPALRFGAAIHRFLEFWHRPTPTDPIERRDLAMSKMQEDFQRSLKPGPMIPLSLEAESMFIAQAEKMCRMYVQRYGNTESEYKIIETEISGDAPLANNHTLRFRLDGLCSHRDRLWIWENKTTARMGEMFLSGFLLDHQVISYAYGTSVILKQPIAGVVLNILRKEGQNISVDFWREVIPVTPEKVQDMVYTFSYDATDIEQRDKTSERDWPQHTKSCRTGYGLCQYWDVCALGVPIEDGPIYTKREPDYVDDPKLLKLGDVASDSPVLE